MKSVLKTYTLLVLSICAFAAILVVGSARAATVTTTSITLSSNANENIAINADYRYYPKYATYTPVGATGSTAKDLRQKCTSTEYKTLPWLAYKAGHITNTAANNMQSQGTCTGDRYDDGGANTTSKGWMPVESYGGWGLRQPTTLKGTTVASRTWTNPLALTTAHGTYPDKFKLLTTAEKATNVIWTSLGLPTADQAVYLFRNNGDADYTNITNEKLLSSGTTYFRNEFTLTQAQVDSILSMSLDVRADDFVKMYINGVPVVGQERSTTCVTGIDCIKKTSTIGRADLVGAYALREGNNVLAFQVNDKATWADNVGGSNTNAAGLWYRAVISLNGDVPGCTNPEATNYNSSATSDNGTCILEPQVTATISCRVTPPSGETPLVVRVEASTTGITAPNFTYNMGDDTGNLTDKPARFWYTYSSPDTYTITASSPLVNDGAPATCTTTAGGTEVNVTDPTGGNGGEVRP